MQWTVMRWIKYLNTLRWITSLPNMARRAPSSSITSLGASEVTRSHLTSFLSPESSAGAGLGRKVGDQTTPGQTKHHRHQDLQRSVEQQHDQAGVPGSEGDAEDDRETGDGQNIIHAGCSNHKTWNTLRMNDEFSRKVSAFL